MHPYCVQQAINVILIDQLLVYIHCKNKHCNQPWQPHHPNATVCSFMALHDSWHLEMITCHYLVFAVLCKFNTILTITPKHRQVFVVQEAHHFTRTPWGKRCNLQSGRGSTLREGNMSLTDKTVDYRAWNVHSLPLSLTHAQMTLNATTRSTLKSQVVFILRYGRHTNLKSTGEKPPQQRRVW